MFSTSEAQNLKDRLEEGPEARSRFKENHIKELIAAQIRMLREKSGLKQAELGELVNMKQSRISHLEDPEYSGVTVKTLLKLSDAFDVGLIVRFAPFNDLCQFTTGLSPTDLAPPSFTEEQLPFAVTSPKEPTSLAIMMHRTNQTIPSAWGLYVHATDPAVEGTAADTGNYPSEEPEPDTIPKGGHAHAVA